MYIHHKPYIIIFLSIAIIILSILIFRSECLFKYKTAPNFENVDSEPIILNDRFNEVNTGKSVKTIDGNYTATLTKQNYGSNKNEEGIVSISINNETKLLHFNPIHEVVNQIFWTKDNLLVLITRADSVHRSVLVYNPEMDKVAFEEFVDGDGIKLSPNQNKIALIEAMPRNTPQEFYSNQLLVSFDIKNYPLINAYPKENNNILFHNLDERHLFYHEALGWSLDSSKFALVEKRFQHNQIVVIEAIDEKFNIIFEKILSEIEGIPTKINWLSNDAIELTYRPYMTPRQKVDDIESINILIKMAEK